MHDFHENNVTVLHGARASRPYCEDGVGEVIDRLDAITHRLDGERCNEEWERRVDAERTELGKLYQARIHDHADALAAVHFLLDNIAAEAEENASPRNALSFHLLSQLSTYLHSQSFRSRPERGSHE